MDYVIKNKSNVYVRLDKNGKAITCSSDNKGVFTYEKAHNIIRGLPKTLRKFHFTVHPIPDTVNPVKKQKEVIETTNYKQPDGVTDWINKFNICDDIISEARKRKDDLICKLSNVDKKMSNELHKIELEPWKNACAGYCEYKEIKNITHERREIKDELLILTYILNMSFTNFDKTRIDETVEKLAHRKFSYRIIEENEDEM